MCSGCAVCAGLALNRILLCVDVVFVVHAMAEVAVGVVLVVYAVAVVRVDVVFVVHVLAVVVVMWCLSCL